MHDHFLRDITYLRISLTDRCNFRCQYCMPKTGVQPLSHYEILTFEEIYTIVHHFAELGITKIRLTGGEPLVRKGIVPFVASLAKLENITDLALTTNGTFLSDYALALKKAGLQRVNISLDSLNPQKFEKITRIGTLNKTIWGIESALNANLGVKINCVLMKDCNDTEILDFIAFAQKYNIEVRFIELLPIGENKSFAQKYFISASEIQKCYDFIPCKPDDIHSPATYFYYKNTNTKIGFITALSNHFCSNCNRIRLTADGKIKPCLLQDVEYDIKTPLRQGKAIATLLEKIILNKPEKHQLAENITSRRIMSKIGG